MTTTLVRSHDVAPQAWRNGGGVTRELLAWPACDDWRVRVSVADIQADGPFSTWPGVRRWFAVLKGAGVELTIDGVAQRLTRSGAPLAFAGDAATHCRLLDGPTRDLNLMLRGARGGLRLADDGLPWQPRAAQCGLFTAVAGHCRADAGEAVALPAYALLWFDPAPASLRFVAGQRPAGATAWWLDATPEASA
jgi:environmental stress-induced protein Ves